MKKKYLQINLILIVLAFTTMNLKEKREDYRMDILINALCDMMLAIPTNQVAFAMDENTGNYLLYELSSYFFKNGIMLSHFIISPYYEYNKTLRILMEDINKRATFYSSTVYIIAANSVTAEEIIKMIEAENLARRNVVYFFYVGKDNLQDNFFLFVNEAFRICLISNTRYGIFQLFCNQAKANENSLRLINWWSKTDGVFRFPLLPIAFETYQNFHKRVFTVPVLHMPPWNFVSYNNGNIVVEGRDDKILKILSSKLNFRYYYFDPPDRSQGSAIVNGSMQGVLALLWEREADIFIGDLTVTYERSLAVDFSFLTLTDNEAFLSHAPERLNEALALIRPFNWKVWPAVVATFLIAGPLVHFFFLAANKWKPHKSNLFYDCAWITISIFLKQSIVMNLKYDRVRFLILLLYLISTYVIGDMYSANLTSMLAKPVRDEPINNLEQLNNAMVTRGFELMVEKHSASHTVLENGTGLYKSIWDKMKNQPTSFLLNSSEEGMVLVRDKKNVAVLGGRETFFYNIKRFGIHHFHLSEKLFTRYSAIALQIGCPFIQNFDKILMQLFEAGILTKITEDEYKKLDEQRPLKREKNSNVEKSNLKDDDNKLRAMSMKMLQGAFYVLICGYTLAGIMFINLLKDSEGFEFQEREIRHLPKEFPPEITGTCYFLLGYRFPGLAPEAPQYVHTYRGAKNEGLGVHPNLHHGLDNN